MKSEDSLRIVLTLCLWIFATTTILCDCPFPRKPPANGRMVYQAPHHSNWTTAPDNYVLRFRCSVGYTMKGAKATLCLSDEWTDKKPYCIKMQCSDPPTIDNGHYALKKGVNNVPTIGSSAEYSCDDGYQLENATDSTLVCYLFTNINRVDWKGTRPVCIKKESCPDPGVSPDGRREGNCCFIGDVVQYFCNDDFDLEGEDSIQCLSGGTWSSPRPRCRPMGDHCDLPPPIPHGIIKGEKGGDFYLPYDEVEVMCEPGFRYKGSTEYIMCEEESGWEEEFDECVEAFCNPPETLANGTIPELESTNITSFPYNFELTYICDKGFRLVHGDSWRFCDTKGWSGKTPHCEVIHCPDPGVPEYGTRIGSSFEIGEKVTFKCFTGYELIGSFERYCMPNGQWGGELARCDHPNNYCPNPGIPVNGVKNSSVYDMGDRISFRCHAGLNLLGSETRECLPNRTWSGEEAKCIGPNDFDNTAKIREILKEAIAEKEEEQKRELEKYRQASYDSWHNGSASKLARKLDLNFQGRLIFYFAFDVSGSVRYNNFRKSVEFAKAIVKRVGISENGARAGALTFSSKAETQFSPLNYNSTEAVLDALDHLNYTGGGTSANSALAALRQQDIPLTQAVLDKRGQKSIIFILTDGKANMGGDPQDEAELLKKEVGAEIYCVGITNTVLQDSLYKIASDPKEEHVFILQDYATMSYLVQEITNGGVDYSECGLGLEKLGRQTNRGKIAGGRKASEPWPWMAALFFTTPDIEAELNCGGSIIHKRYILSAAHCFYTKNLNVRKEKEIIVKLGLTNVKNESDMQEFEVEKLFIHPLFNPEPTLDYDIALLKLTRPIEFSALVRTICLPPLELAPNSTLYKPGEFTVATGWGHSGVVKDRGHYDYKSEENLKEVILPIQSRERCMQSVKDNNRDPRMFTERMFCVGDGRGGNDSCKGDSGGPLMQSQLNEEGYIYWTQVGIVSWGFGCGLPNTYGYYSHVQKLLSWLMDTIQSQDDN